MSTQEQRERFEVWARSENYPLGYDGSNGSDYIDAATSCAYMGWQAAQAAAIERCMAAISQQDEACTGATMQVKCLRALRALLPKEES